MPTLKIMKIVPGAHPPERGHHGDLGYDLFAAERAVIPHGATLAVRTGIAAEFPDGWGAVVKDRSSMALKGIATLAGVIDHGYRGEIKVVLLNLSGADIKIEPDQKIAQMIPTPVTDWNVTVCETLNDTARGANGFGSTGTHKQTV